MLPLLPSFAPTHHPSPWSPYSLTHSIYVQWKAGDTPEYAMLTDLSPAAQVVSRPGMGNNYRTACDNGIRSAGAHCFNFGADPGQVAVMYREAVSNNEVSSCMPVLVDRPRTLNKPFKRPTVFFIRMPIEKSRNETPQILTLQGNNSAVINNMNVVVEVPGIEEVWKAINGQSNTIDAKSATLEPIMLEHAAVQFHLRWPPSESDVDNSHSRLRDLMSITGASPNSTDYSTAISSS